MNNEITAAHKTSLPEKQQWSNRAFCAHACAKKNAPFTRIYCGQWLSPQYTEPCVLYKINIMNMNNLPQILKHRHTQNWRVKWENRPSFIGGWTNPLKLMVPYNLSSILMRSQICYLLVLGRIPFYLQNCLNSSLHGFNKVLETFLRDFGPYWHDSICCRLVSWTSRMRMPQYSAGSIGIRRCTLWS